jgi:hypothetical protein
MALEHEGDRQRQSGLARHKRVRIQEIGGGITATCMCHLGYLADALGRLTLTQHFRAHSFSPGMEGLNGND